VSLGLVIVRPNVEKELLKRINDLRLKVTLTFSIPWFLAVYTHWTFQ
jgi:hypothetical protein